MVRLAAGGFAASLAGGLCGGVVMALTSLVGALGFEMALGEARWADLAPDLGQAILIYASLGAVFGVAVATPLTALFGHLLLWLTRQQPQRRRRAALIGGAVTGAILAGPVNAAISLSMGDATTLPLAPLIAALSVAGAVAGMIAASVFLTVRRWLVPDAPPPTLAPDPALQTEASS